MTADAEKSSPVPVMSKCRIVKNLAVVCLGFLFLFCAYQSLASLQTTVNSRGGLAQSLIYASLALSSLLFPKLLIGRLGCKTTLVLSILAYLPFMASNYFRDLPSQLVTSVLLGAGAATLWSSACTYINEISLLYSAHVSQPVDLVTTQFFGLFFMVFQNSQIWGNLVSFYVLKPSTHDPFPPVEDTLNTTFVPCGARFCGGVGRSDGRLPEEKRLLLVSVYIAFSALSALVVALLLDPLQRSERGKDSDPLLSTLTATLKHMRKTDQLLLIPLTVFIGFQQAFVLSEFSQAYIACAWGLHNVSLVFIFFGAVNSVSCFVIGRLSKYVPRLCILWAGAAGNTGACVVLFLWDPDGTRTLYYFLVIGLWALSDSVWMTVVNSTYGILFRSDEEAAFANLRLWEAVGFFLPYFFNTLLCMSSKLYIVMALLAVSITGGSVVEVKNGLKKKSIVITKQ